jgi:hypothetical protein
MVGFGWNSCVIGGMLAGAIFSAAYADPVVSDGSDGPFSPPGGLVTLDLPDDGIFNFTTVDIPAGTTVKFNRNAANTPVYLAATGDVVIAGILDVSAAATDILLPPVPANPKQSGGPGGFDGGDGGDESGAVGHDGGGPGSGGGGYSAGGAGNAEAGEQPTRYSTEGAGFGGPAVSYPDPLAGGSGGGGGSAVYWFGWYVGGFGGGGGGAVQISTPGSITIDGSILGNGANGGWGYASALAHGGAGGGGAGGNVELHGATINVGSGALIQVRGGYGGGLSTQPYSSDPAAYSSGGDGGMGYVYFSAAGLDIAGTVDGEQVIASPSDVPGLDVANRSWLAQNHPNPFNPGTTITFYLPSERPVSLRVYDVGGRLVKTLIDDRVAARGRNTVVWRGRSADGRLAPAGIYFYSLEAEGHCETKRMVLVK